MEQPAVFKAIREFSISHLNSSIKEQYMGGKRQRTFAESSNSPVTDLFVGLTLSPYAVCQEKEEKKKNESISPFAILSSISYCPCLFLP